MTEQELAELAVRLGAALAARGWQVATAESCTGGWVAKALTDVAGSSAWFGYGFVTYSNAAKQRLLQVSAKVLEAHGAVSEPVVRAMAEGARSVSGAEAAVAVSGVAGPGGGTADKPVGLVWFAWASPWSVRAESRRFEGGRDAVRRASVAHALQGLIASVEARGEARETRSAAGEASREAGEASREAGEALPEAGEASPEAGQRSSEAGGGADA